MSRSSLRFVAFIVLALLGAPVAMHVVMHDLHDHHDEVAEAYGAKTGHSDHEHPIVSSPAPQLPDVTRVTLPVATVPAATAATWTRIASTDRNVLSFGALRMDDDVGLQPLLSTFLI
jgi:hypothetical protein